MTAISSGKPSPAEFIPIAEDAGLIGALGWCMLDQSCRFLRQIRDLGYAPDLRVSVNVSPQQLDDPEFPVRRWLERWDRLRLAP